MTTLGIETSCDETSIAVIVDGKLKSNLISSQDFHVKYGGVVPELSSRAHLQMIQPLVKQALEEAEIKRDEVDLIVKYNLTSSVDLLGIYSYLNAGDFITKNDIAQNDASKTFLQFIYKW